MNYLHNNNVRILPTLELLSVFGIQPHSTELEFSSTTILSNIEDESPRLNPTQNLVVSGMEINCHFSRSPLELEYTTVSAISSVSQLSNPTIVLRKQINNKYQELTGGQDVP